MNEVLNKDDILYLLTLIKCDAKSIIKLCGELESEPDQDYLNAVEVLAKDIKGHEDTLSDALEKILK